METKVANYLKRCPYCSEAIRAEAVICRFCGRDIAIGQVFVSSKLGTEPLSPLLDHKVKIMTSKGWQIVNRTPAAAQLRKPKQWISGCLILFVLLPLLGGFFLPALFGVAVVGLTLCVIAYLLENEETVYCTEEQLRQEEQLNLQRQHEEEQRRKKVRSPEERRQHIIGLVFVCIVLAGILVFIFMAYTYPMIR